MNRGIVGYVLRVATFLIVGPVIGGVLFVLFTSLANGDLRAGAIGAFAILLLAFAGLPFFLVGCYMLGWKAALATGLVIAFVGPQIRSRSLLFVVAAAAGAVAAAWLGSEGPEGKSSTVILIGLVGAASAAACAFFLDRIDMMRPKQAPLA